MMTIDTDQIIEIVGYVASFFVLLSFTMRDVKKLRRINSVGCSIFVVYGVLLNWSFPIIITNVAILCINVYYIFLKKS